MELVEVKKNCKNCNSTLMTAASYCHCCGARVIRDRLSLKRFLQDFFHKFFGWENTYFKTFKKMIVSPEVVISDYINGVRKRFMPPITFFAIGLTILALIFNAYSEKYTEFSTGLYNNSFHEGFHEGFSEEQLDATKEKDSSKIVGAKNHKLAFEDYKNDRIGSQKKVIDNTLKYYNLMSFLGLPLYALISMLVFGWKKHNYSEHLIISCYIQGLIMIGLLLTFVLAMLIHPSIYPFSMLISLFYYPFVYKRIYGLSRGKTVLKFGKFVIVITVTIILILALLVGGVYLYKNY